MLWLIVGYFVRPLLLYFVLPLSLFMLSTRKQYMEILLGFVFILILSDSRLAPIHDFAKDAKEIYILLMTLFMLGDTGNFTPFNGLVLRFIPFFIVSVICIFYTPPENLATSIEKTTSYFLLLLAVPNYVQKAYLDHGKNFFKALVYLVILILLMGFVFRVIAPNITIREDRYQGLFGNPNGLGIFCVLTFFLLSIVLEIYPNIFEKNEKRIFYGVIILSIILSGSRGSLFALLIFFVFSFFYKKSTAIGTIIAVVVTASYGYISDHLAQVVNFLGLGDYFRLYTLQAGSGRFVAWDFSWQHIQESYWLGRGFEYTEYLFNLPENVVYLQALGHLGNAHNSYITLWLDTGLIGLSTYTLAFTTCIIKAAGKTRIAVPLMFAAVFSSFFESWLTASLNPFTILLFVSLSIISSDVIIPGKIKAAVPVQ